MSNTNALQELSNAMRQAVATAAPSIVRVLDGSRLTASGVVWDRRGYVVATSHGVEKDEDLEVEFEDGSVTSATLVGRDAESDLALLKVDMPNATPVTFADLQEVGPGSMALALGRPGDAGLHASLGIVSAAASRVFYTDAQLYPGFSGGALVDVKGALIGLLNLGHRRGRGLAFSHQAVSEIVTQLEGKGHVSRPYLGISTQPVELGAIAKSAGVSQSTGLLITSVEDASPAESARLMIGDVLLALDGQSLDSYRDLRAVLRSKSANDSVQVQLIRAGATQSLTAVLGERKR